MRTRVAQIRRKTDYLQGAISRASPSARGVFFDGTRIDNKAINVAQSNFTRRNESEKRSLIFIVAIMDFITCFEEPWKGVEGIEKENINSNERIVRRYIYIYIRCISSGCWYCFFFSTFPNQLFTVLLTAIVFHHSDTLWIVPFLFFSNNSGQANEDTISAKYLHVERVK